MRGQLKVGHHIEVGEVAGVIDAINPVTLQVTTADGIRVHVPLHLLTEQIFSTSPARSTT